MMWTQSEHHLKQFSTGDKLTVKTYTLHGTDPGPHIHIQASVHGAEIQGNAVILKLMERLKEVKSFKGSLTIIPLANPYGTINKHGTYTYGRYNPVTGDNWNRNYLDLSKEAEFDLKNFCDQHENKTSLEIHTLYKLYLSETFERIYQRLEQSFQISDNNRINLFLQGLALKADGVLDLHTGPTATRYLYTPEYAQMIARKLLFPFTLLIPHSFDGAMDEACFMPWVTLKDELHKRGKTDFNLDYEAFTLEFGSEETFDMTKGARDVLSIINYLRYKSLLEGEVEEMSSVECPLKNYITLFAPIGGLCDYHFAPGEHFNKGNTLATLYQLKDLNPENPLESCQHEIKANFDGVVINRCPSGNIHQGMDMFQVFKLSEQRSVQD